MTDCSVECLWLARAAEACYCSVVLAYPSAALDQVDQVGLQAGPASSGLDRAGRLQIVHWASVCLVAVMLPFAPCWSLDAKTVGASSGHFDPSSVHARSAESDLDPSYLRKVSLHIHAKRRASIAMNDFSLPRISLGFGEGSPPLWLPCGDMPGAN